MYNKIYMMKKVMLIMAILFTVVARGYGQYGSEIIFDKDYGKISSMEYFTYNAIDEFGDLKKDTLAFSSKNKYNRKGDVIYKKFHGNNFFYKYKYTYVKGNKVKKEQYYCSKYYKALPIITSYKYDNSDNLIQESKYYDDGRIYQKKFHTYDNANKKIETIYYDYNNYMNYRCSYFYKKNKLERTKEFIYVDTENPYIIEYEYSPNKRIQKRYGKGEICRVKHEETIDSRGNITLDVNYYDPNDFNPKVVFKAIFSKTYVYTYDNKGNWIKCIDYIQGEVSYITERVITYYE